MALQNGSVGNLYNNPISAAEAQYMQQQQLSTSGRAGSANGAVVVMDGFGGGGAISTRQTEEPPIVPNHHQQVRSLNRLMNIRIISRGRFNHDWESSCT